MVKVRYAKVFSVKGRFVQEVIFSDGKRKSFEGTFYIKGDKTRWEYAPPEEQVVVTDGRKVYIYDPFVDQVQEGYLEFPIVYRDLLFDPDRLKSFFKVDEKGNRLLLVPKRESQVKLIEVCIEKDGSIKEVKVVDAMDNTTVIVLSKVKENIKIRDDFFSLKELVGKDHG